MDEVIITGSNFGACCNDEFVVRIAEGDKQAEQQFVVHFTPLLSAFIAKKLNEKELHADVLQETFIRVLIKLRAQQVVKPEALKSYLMSIANYLIFEVIRRRNVDLRDHSDIDIELIAHTQSDGFKAIEFKDNKRRLLEMIATLNVPRDRALITAYLIENKDKTQICQQLSLSAVQFDRILYRAKNRLVKHQTCDAQ